VERDNKQIRRFVKRHNEQNECSTRIKETMNKRWHSKRWEKAYTVR